MLADAELTLLDAVDGVAYIVSDDGIVRGVGVRNWSQFAHDNQAPWLADTTRVVGRPYLEFIAGDAVARTYEFFFDELRAGTLDRLALAYRCDSPSRRRHMRLSITPIRRNEVLQGFLFQNTVMSSAVHPPLDIFDFSAGQATPESDDRPVVGLCSFCQRVAPLSPTVSKAISGREWLEAEEYYRQGGSSEVRVAHAVCPDCAVGNFGIAGGDAPARTGRDG